MNQSLSVPEHAFSYIRQAIEGFENIGHRAGKWHLPFISKEYTNDADGAGYLGRLCNMQSRVSILQKPSSTQADMSRSISTLVGGRARLPYCRVVASSRALHTNSAVHQSLLPHHHNSQRLRHPTLTINTARYVSMSSAATRRLVKTSFQLQR